MSTLASIEIEIRNIEIAFSAETNSQLSESLLEEMRIKYMGKKGLITLLASQIGTVSVEEKPAVGQAINTIKQKIGGAIDTLIAKAKEEAYNQSLLSKKIDVTLPGRKRSIGCKHPLTLIKEEILFSFNKMGFLTVEGPEIESDYYNFEALNIPADHPARDSQDSFYLKDHFLLRTQTSPVQIRTMEKVKPPIAIVSPGRVFRRDSIDASHSPTFHQIEGLYVAQNVTMTDLKGILQSFCREMFGADANIRLRPDFFPFTEPSCEISVTCSRCKGTGCSTCGGDGWLEILGAGLVNPLVLKNVGIDPDKYSGLAFGMGIERIAMLKYGVTDIRYFYENSYPFLSQFKQI